MKFEVFSGMPSGTDYGVVLKWAELDKGDFIVAFFASGNPFNPEVVDEFSWIVESKDGNVVYLSKRNPLHTPIFGLDQMEWESFKREVLPVVDEYIENQEKP